MNNCNPFDLCYSKNKPNKQDKESKKSDDKKSKKSKSSKNESHNNPSKNESHNNPSKNESHNNPSKNLEDKSKIQNNRSQISKMNESINDSQMSKMNESIDHSQMSKMNESIDHSQMSKMNESIDHSQMSKMNESIDHYQMSKMNESIDHSQMCNYGQFEKNNKSQVQKDDEKISNNILQIKNILNNKDVKQNIKNDLSGGVNSAIDKMSDKNNSIIENVENLNENQQIQIEKTSEFVEFGNDSNSIKNDNVDNNNFDHKKKYRYE